MKELILKLAEERTWVSDNFSRLDAFIGSKQFNALSQHARDLLLQQSQIMKMYINTLNMRILEITKEPEEAEDGRNS